MAKTFNYKKVQELRNLLTDEISNHSTVMTVEHLKLAEMRLQTAIMAGLDDRDVDKEKLQWQRNTS